MRLSEDQGIIANRGVLEDMGVRRETERMDRVRKSMLGMLYAQDASDVFMSPEGPTEMTGDCDLCSK